MDGGLGDIWSTKAFAYESPLKDLLDSENYTVEQLLEQDELLQELRGMHPTLIEYFSQEESLVKLIQYIIQEPLPLEHRDSVSITENPNLKMAEGEVDEWEAQTPPTPYYTARDVEVLRYPYVACEVICSEINAILDTVVDGQISRIISSPNYEKGHIEDFHHSKPITILDLLFSLVYSTGKGQLDDYRAGYFDKILTVLCRTRPSALSTYLNEGGGKGRLVLMKALINHLYSHSILQVVQRLMMPNSSTFYTNGDAQNITFATNDDCQEDPQTLFRSKWADSPEGVDMLLDCILNVGDESNYELRLSEAQNASEVLITIIQNSPLMSPIILRLTQEPILPQLMQAASSRKQSFSPHDNHLTCAMNVLEALILQLGGYGSVNSEDDGTVRQQTIPMANADTLILHLPYLLDRLKTLLRHDSTRLWFSPMQFSSDPQPILGTSRLRIVRLVESLVLLGNIQVDELLCKSDILQACLDLFWEFEWNSMLHQSVANLLVHVFEGQNSRSILQKYFLLDCNLLQRLIESFECEKEEELSSPDLADSTDEADVLPISDEDIDTVIASQQEGSPSSDEATSDKAVLAPDDYDDDDVIERDPRDRSAPVGKQTSTRSLDLGGLKDVLCTGKDAPSHIPSLRKGYMGHVIIVCQALVHACTSAPSEGFMTAGNIEYSDNNKGNEEEFSSFLTSPLTHTSVSNDPGDRLIIAELISHHPMQAKWQDFVTSTLAAETAIQSTPLGGFQINGVAIDPIHSHRPGPDIGNFNDDYDDDDDEDLTPSGVVIDMDDNDIEIAASMIDSLSLPKTREFDSEAFTSLNRGGNYVFDDPLGGGHHFEANFDDVVVDNEDDDHLNQRASGEWDPPVMDLFAGNIPFETNRSSGEVGSDTWSSFASFDDAFSVPIQDSRRLESPTIGVESNVLFTSSTAEGNSSNVDDIFGAPAAHNFLLDTADFEDETSPTEIVHDGMAMTYYSSSRRGEDSDDSSVEECDDPKEVVSHEDSTSPEEPVVA